MTVEGLTDDGASTVSAWVQREVAVYLTAGGFGAAVHVHRVTVPAAYM